MDSPPNLPEKHMMAQSGQVSDLDGPVLVPRDALPVVHTMAVPS